MLSSGVCAAATYTERFTVVNNCADNAWMWVVPPGPDLAEEQSQFWETENNGLRVCKNDEDPCATRNYQWKIEIAAGATQSFKIPDQGAASNKVYFNLACEETTGTYAEWGKCIIGGEFGTSVLGNDLTSSNTWFEATWGCSDASGVDCVANPSQPSEALSNQDWLDISLVDGYTVPMKIELGTGEATSKNCQFQGGTAWDGIEDVGFVDLASCPTETSSTMYSSNAAIQNQLENGGINLLTENEGYYVNCAAPHAWLSGNVLGTNISPSPRPLIAGDTPETLNATNWYGCTGTCGGTAGESGCTCPECGKSQCLEGPNGDGRFTVAETAYVTRLKAMGVESYTWQYDDDNGLKHCDQGAHVTLTLCPAQAGQKPYDPAQRWNYDSESGECVLASSSAPYTSYFECVSSHLTYGKIDEVAGNNRKIIYCVPNEDGKYDDYENCIHPTSTHADIWWRKASQGLNGVWFMNGESIDSESMIHSVPGQWEFGCLADFNGDGENDVFWHDPSAGKTGVQLLSDTSVSSQYLSVNVPSPWSVGGCGDFNADGQMDVFWNNPDTGRNGVTYLEADGSLKGDYGFLAESSTVWLPRGAADFDGDSRPDMVFRNASSGEVVIMLLKGLVNSGVHKVTTVSTEWDIKGVADFNDDDKPDLLWRNETSGENGVMYLDEVTAGSYELIEGLDPAKDWDIAGAGVLH